MFFPPFRCKPRRRSRSTQQIESLEPRELLAAATQLSSAEVTKLLDRASMATSTNDAIIAVVDRGGHILGVRVEQDVLDSIAALDTGVGTDPTAIDSGLEEETLVYAIDGAVAKARTAAFFASGTLDSRIVPGVADPDGTITPEVSPLTSRTIRNISQSTVTQREVQSNPNITDPDSTLRGPGFVAPIGVGQHFPPQVAHGPQVDLLAIEHTNRDSIVHAGFDAIRGNADDIALEQRFNIDPAFIPNGQVIDAPESYGFTSGRMPNAQARGIATLPGGVPIYRIFDPTTQTIVGLDQIGGIGVFFPGTSDPDGAGPGRIGDATFEQNFPNAKTELERTNAPKVLEAEFIALYSIGGAMFGGLTLAKDRFFGGDFPIPFGRIDLVGINLQIIGPTPGISGVRTIEAVGNKVQPGAATLVTRINANDTTLTISNASGLPATPFTIRIESEVLTVTNVLGTTLTVTRDPSIPAQFNKMKIHRAGVAISTGSGENQPITTTSSVFVALDNNPATTTLVVPNATVFPATPFTIFIDDEEILVTGFAATPDFVAPEFMIVEDTLTIERAKNGTTAAAHAIGATIRTAPSTTPVTGRAAPEGWLVMPHDSPILAKATSTLAVALGAADLALVVPDASVFPPVDGDAGTIDFSIRIDEEEIAVTDVNLATDTLTIIRARRGTVAESHDIGATIFTKEMTAEITAAQVRTIIEQGIIVAGDQEQRLTLTDGRTDDGRRVRAAIRLEVKIVNMNNLTAFRGDNQKQLNRVRTNPGAPVSMVLAVGDKDGNVLGLYRMHDSPIFSIDVAVAKARNTAYYADPDPITGGLGVLDHVDDDEDGIADVAPGTAFTNRTFRFLAEPRFPQGVDGSTPGPFSILREKDIAGVSVFQTEFLRSRRPTTAVQAALNNPDFNGGDPAKASDFKTVYGFDSFNPGRNFHDPNNIANQNGIIFFPGSTPLYNNTTNALIGGFGISGDGVDQDDVVTFYGAQGFLPPEAISSADDVRVRNTRLPFQKFNRHPFG